jgi:hypothetical protein
VVTVKLLLVCIVFCSTNGLVGGLDGLSHRFGGTGARLVMEMESGWLITKNNAGDGD